MSGWVEVRWLFAGHRPWHQSQPWTHVINVGSIVDQNSDMYGSLFGVRNISLYRPLAPDRGFPADLSLVVAQHVEQLQHYLVTGEGGQASWLTWTEVDEIDWDELAQTTEPVGLFLGRPNRDTPTRAYRAGGCCYSTLCVGSPKTMAATTCGSSSGLIASVTPAAAGELFEHLWVNYLTRDSCRE